jgi:hypothetical protein
MAELVVPVREHVHATYVVPLPAPTTVKAATQVIATAVAETVTGRQAIGLPEPFNALVMSWLHQGNVRISVLEDPRSATEAEDLPLELRQFLTTAPAFAVITAVHPASLLAVQEWRARATAVALAAGLGAAVFELSALQLLDVPTIIASLPRVTLSGEMSEVTFDARPWIASQTLEHLGMYWAVSDGMGYFGLPDLWIGGTTRDLRDELAQIVRGLACHILGCLAEDVRDANGDDAIMTLPRSVRIPEVLEIHRMHLDAVRGVPNRGGAWTEVRLSFDEDSSGHHWLTLGPPPGCDSDADEFVGGLCHAMFGFEKPRWHYLPVVDSRDSIPATRRRFLAGELPKGGQLLIRYCADTDGSFTWARVSSWSDEDHAVVRDTGRELRPGVEVGPAKQVPSQQIVDWAIWVDGTGVIEGGLTETVAA